MKLRDFLKDNIIITDGSMGTYFSQLTGTAGGFSELANLSAPDIVKSIHLEYMDAGARLLRTNTFSANTATLGIPMQEVIQLIAKGYQIAREAAEGTDTFVAADIGPIPYTEKDPKSIEDEYKLISDTFLKAGADIFIFETFGSTEYLEEITGYIKQNNPDTFILAQFATTPDGFTRKGTSCETIVHEVRKISTIDAYGFNCGAGPTHLYNSLRKLNLADDIVSVLPNAGYPQIINERTVYVENPAYFAEVMSNIRDLGAKLLGGCCGTTPIHIRKLAERLDMKPSMPVHGIRTDSRKPIAQTVENKFFHSLKSGKFVVAVELDPPFDADIEKVLKNAKICREHGVDIITIADSPMARARVDSVMLSSRIQRETGMETMPHLCCRDKNSNALKSCLLAAYSEGIRNVLAVTGDPIPSADKSEIKSVFNMNSQNLMEMISEMNRELFKNDPFAIGGALNLNVINRDAEVGRMYRKQEKGASFFLTQPIFSSDTIDYLSAMRREKNVKILGGILPLVSYRNAMFLNNEIPGISIPDEILGQFKPDMSREEAEQTGIRLAVELAEKIKPFIDGFYFITPFNRAEMVVQIMKKVL